MAWLSLILRWARGCKNHLLSTYFKAGTLQDSSHGVAWLLSTVLWGRCRSHFIGVKTEVQRGWVPAWLIECNLNPHLSNGRGLSATLPFKWGVPSGRICWAAQCSTWPKEVFSATAQDIFSGIVYVLWLLCWGQEGHLLVEGQHTYLLLWADGWTLWPLEPVSASHCQKAAVWKESLVPPYLRADVLNGWGLTLFFTKKNCATILLKVKLSIR